jgi:hypothetical protein
MVRPNDRRRRGTKFGVAVAVTLMLTICLSVGSSNATNKQTPTSCLWGASSTTATFEDGQLTVSPTETSGCTTETVTGG